MGFIVIFSFWSINYIAVELEMPFGDDLNDLPLHDMQEDFNRSLKTLLVQKAQKVPHFSYNPEQHDALETKQTDFDKNLVDYKRVTQIEFEDAALLEQELGKKEYGKKVINKKEEKAHLADSQMPIAAALALPPVAVADAPPPAAPPAQIRTDAPRPPDQVCVHCLESPSPPINAEQQQGPGYQNVLKPQSAREEFGATSMIVSIGGEGGSAPNMLCGGASSICDEKSRLIEERPHFILGAGRGTAYKAGYTGTSSSSEDCLQSLRATADGTSSACDQARDLARIRICIEENLPIISQEIQVMSQKKLRL